MTNEETPNDEFVRVWSLSERLLLAGACFVVLAMLPRPACGVPLTDLFNGAFLDVGSSRFSNWQLVSLDSEGAPSPDLAQIGVNPLASDPANPGLQFVGNNQLSISGFSSIDLVLKYRVQRLAGGNTYAGHTVAMTGITFGGTGGIAYVSDGLTSIGGGQLASVDDLAGMLDDMGQGHSAFQKRRVFVRYI